MAKPSIYRDDQRDTNEPLAVDAERAAELLSLSSKTVRALAKAGKLPHKRIGGRLLFPVDALRAWANDPAPVAAPNDAA